VTWREHERGGREQPKNNNPSLSNRTRKGRRKIEKDQLPLEEDALRGMGKVDRAEGGVGKFGFLGVS